MKILSEIKLLIGSCLMAIACCGFTVVNCYAQDDSSAKQPAKKAYVTNTFKGNLLIDNQTVMVPVKNTIEFSIQHRFGIVNNGYSDFYGLFAPANIRLGINYVPVSNLQLGIGLCKGNMLLDGNVKYAIIKQAVSGGSPVSVTYYGVMAVSTLPMAGNFVSNSDRVSYFNQLMIARRVTKKFSVQVAGSLSYFNNIAGYVATDGTIQPTMKNANFSVSIMGRYMITDGFGVIANYDQPLTQNPMNNPHPNVCFGIELSTIGHTFQVFAGNCQAIVPQYNNIFNQNDYSIGQFLVGFNITRRWYRSAD